MLSFISIWALIQARDDHAAPQVLAAANYHGWAVPGWGLNIFLQYLLAYWAAGQAHISLLKTLESVLILWAAVVSVHIVVLFGCVS